MTIAGVVIVLTGLGMAVIKTAGASPGFLVKFAALFKLSYLQFSLLIAIAGGLVLLTDLAITWYKFHPVNFHKDRKTTNGTNKQNKL